MKKISVSLFIFLFISLFARSVAAQDAAPVSLLAPIADQTVVPSTNSEPVADIDEDDDAKDKDDAKKVVDKVNEVIQKIYDRIIASKARYNELAGFDEKCLTKDESGFLSLRYESQTPSSRGETYPFVFRIGVEPQKGKISAEDQQQGYFDYKLPLLNLQFSGYAVKHPLRRQFDIQKVLEECAEDLVDYQQQFMPLRFMIIVDEKSFKVNKPIFFKVVLLNVSEHNILVKGLDKETLFFTLNNNFWGTQPGEVTQALSPREQRRQDAAKRTAMRRLARQRKKDVGTQTIIGRRTKVGDQIILHADEALVIDFQGEGYRRAQDVDIRGIYQLNVKGLRPTAKVKIKIVDE
jgi:hypothetical protein